MVKDLKGILGMVSLNIYQITNYSIYSKEHIICLIFKRLGFSINIKMWLCEARFYFKIRLFEMSMFWLNWLRRWESVYLNGFVPDNDHTFSSLRQLKSICSFHVSKIFNFQNAMHKCWKHKSIHFIHVRTKFFSKSTRKSVTITELQIAPD